MRPYHPDGKRSVAKIAAAKGNLTISLCIPARDEASTIGPIVSAVRRALVDEVALIDQVLVADDGSTDGTSEQARSAGAEVLAVATAVPVLDQRPGKGEAMWKSLAVSTGDLVVWVDGDLDPFDARWPARLVAPLVFDQDVSLVKGSYRRLSPNPSTGGGRVTELVARPALAMLHPRLAGIAQPLGGEYAARRTSLVDVPFAGGYGVDLGLLIDICQRDGLESIAQVDLGERRHRNRPLEELSIQAAEVLHVALRRAGVAVDAPPTLPVPFASATTFETRDRPPLSSILDQADRATA